MHWRISEPAQLLEAIRICLQRGGQFLRSRVAPNGPILDQPSLSYVSKPSWGMYAAGVDHDTIARLLDWAQQEGLRENGDFFIPGERPEYKDLQRVYRPLTFGKVAAWLDHPVIRQPKVLDRLLQYQHKPTGGVFHYIGDDPEHVEEQPTIGTLNTTFFGQFTLALGMREQALSVGEWVRQWVDANREHMANRCIYGQMTMDGRLVTEVGPGEKIFKVVDTRGAKQEFWHVGTTMAYLADLYEAMRTRWDDTHEKARPYLDAALALLDFESRMPLDTYLWPSKCKVAWGAGELLRVLVEYDLGDQETIEKAYRVAERVAIFTFMDNQLPNGGWSCMHYPLRDGIPELALNYKPLQGTVRVPPKRVDGSETIFLPGEEITGEFLGELRSMEQGVAAWMKHSKENRLGR